MGIKAALKRLFGKVEAPKVSDKFIPNRDQQELLDLVKSWFDGTNIKLVGFDLIKQEDDKWSTHIGVAVNADSHINPGTHFERQAGEACFTEPWDENQFGEEGLEMIALAGMSFERQVANVQTMGHYAWDLVDAFGLDIEAGDQLQFNDKYYWIAKK